MSPTGAADCTTGAVAGAEPEADCTTGGAAAVCIAASTGHGDRAVAASATAGRAAVDSAASTAGTADGLSCRWPCCTHH